ncbi:MAG: Holliday junction branch migration protein RuvA [Gammaproteobacteria bacterium]|nr:Holliday junction branch migration protein RuvA [Gammaproteobacteria bacterium]
MIGRLKGNVVDILDNVVLLDVNGIGYEIEVTSTTLTNLQVSDTETIIFTHFVVREDAHSLYGFANQEERDLFRNLIKVNGIGPKLGLTILSSIGPERFITYVSERDVTAITSIPGVGKKTAERLVLDLKDKLVNGFQTVVPMSPAGNESFQEAKLALVSLGYKPTEASKVLEQIYNEDQAVEELIRAALQRLAVTA